MAQDLYEICEAMAEMEATNMAVMGLKEAHALLPDDDATILLPCTLRYPRKGRYSFGTISGHPQGTVGSAPILDGAHLIETVVLVGKATDSKSKLTRACAKWVGIVPKVYAAHRALGGVVQSVTVGDYEFTRMELDGGEYAGVAFVMTVDNVENVTVGQ